MPQQKFHGVEIVVYLFFTKQSFFVALTDLSAMQLASDRNRRLQQIPMLLRKLQIRQTICT